MKKFEFFGFMSVAWPRFAARLAYYVVATALLAWQARGATIPTVLVGNPGNPADTRYGVFGSVADEYRIGTTEVTNAQYAEFLNAVDPTGLNTLALYKTNMASDPVGGIILNSGAANGSKYALKSGRGNNPVAFVSWYDSLRFANWLHNGQANGDTENGAYTLLGDTPTPSNGNSITRNAGAVWWLPSENEWYKSAYHKNDGVTGNYWDYPTGTNTIPYSDQPPGIDAPVQSSTANFRKNDSVANGYDDGYAVTGSPLLPSGNPLTDAGAYELSTSAYGTFDQGGNLREWNEALILAPYRGLRGGFWGSLHDILRASYRDFISATSEGSNISFRVATIAKPEGIAGDFNNDGAVDAADYVVWRKNSDGLYTPNDFNVWRGNFGARLGTGASAAGFHKRAVSEPVSLALLFLAGLITSSSARGRCAGSNNHLMTRGVS